MSKTSAFWLASISALMIGTAPVALAQNQNDANVTIIKPGEAAENAAEATGEAVENAAEATGNAVENAAEATADAAGDAVDATAQAADNAADATAEAASDAAQATENAAEATADAAGDAADATADAAGDAADATADAAGDAVDAAGDAADATADAAGDAAEAAGDAAAATGEAVENAAEGAADADVTVVTTEPAEGTPVEGQIFQQSADTFLASSMMGAIVRNSAGDEIGDVNNLIVTSDGTVEGVVIGVGGFLGIGEKRVAIELSRINITQNEDGDLMLMLDATEEELENAPAFRSEDDMQ